MRKILAIMTLGLFLLIAPSYTRAQTAPSAQKETKPVIKLIVIGTPDATAKIFINSMTETISKGLTVQNTPADKNDASVPEIHVFVAGSDDKGTFVDVVVVFHVKGHDAPAYLGMLGGLITPDNAVDAAQEVLGKAGNAIDEYIDELSSEPDSTPASPSTTPNTKKKSDTVEPDIYSHA